MNKANGTDGWNKAALLLVGHGSSRLTASRLATARLAEAIRGMALFAEVQECFWKEQPLLSLDLVRAQTVYVVPNFAGEGSFTRRLIPQKLDLSGQLSTVRGRRVVYCEPVGCHPAIPGLLRRRAEELCAGHGLDPARVALLIVGHGSRSGGVSRTPEAIAAALRAAGRFAEVATAYIEQAPWVADWPAAVDAAQVIVAPLLISEGMHASEDLPPLFGLRAPVGGPAAAAGRSVWLMGGIGRDPEVAEVILDQVRRADIRLATPAACSFDL